MSYILTFCNLFAILAVAVRAIRWITQIHYKLNPEQKKAAESHRVRNFKKLEDLQKIFSTVELDFE